METKPHDNQEYILLFRNSNWDKDLSADQIQQALDKFMAWFDSLAEEGKLSAGRPLMPGGKVLKGNGPDAQPTVSDGPFTESKEEVGGFFLLTVDSMDEAMEIARQCPILSLGSVVEVREVASECPSFQRLAQMTEAND